MWTTAHEPNYEVLQEAQVDQLVQGNVAGTLRSLPAVVAPMKKPQKILVQAHPDNNGPLLIGRTSPLADDGSNGGHFLAPGEMWVLPDNTIAAWKLRGTGAGGQKLQVTYMSGGN